MQAIGATYNHPREGGRRTMTFLEGLVPRGVDTQFKVAFLL
jgi:hypothetical protein